MATKLDKPLKREDRGRGQALHADDRPEGLKLVPRASATATSSAWEALVSGEAALAAALNASLQR